MTEDTFDIELPVDMEFEQPFEVELDHGEFDGAAIKSYNDLNDLPKLDGRTIIGDLPELDPTVPAWAKAPTKPDYNAEEVGAIPEGTMVQLDAGDFAEMWEATI